MKKSRFLNLELNMKERKRSHGVTLISVLIMVIVMVIIASIAILGGRQVLNDSKETSRQETIATIKAKVNQISLQNNTAGVFTPASQSQYGEKATNHFQVNDYSLEDWYILNKEDLEDMGVKYVDNSYVVNYKTNEVYALTEFDEYIEKKGKELVNVDSTNKYTVNFHPDDEASVTGTMPSQNFVYGVSQYLNQNQYTKKGYHFIAWTRNSNGTGDTYSDREKVLNLTNEENGVVDLYTKWQVNSYTVVFSANGGTGTIPEQSFIYDIEQNLNSNLFSKTGYSFGGWNTRSNGTGTSYANLESVKNLTSSNNGVVTLYAQWNANTYTVTFNCGSEATLNNSSKDVTYGEAYGELPTPERTGYSFNGWYTEQNGGSKITASSIVSVANAHALYARWTANTCTITFNGGDGVTVTPDHIDRTVGEQYGELPTPSKTGYTFDGWFTLAEGGTKVESTDTVTVAGSQTLYAHWTANRHTIYKANIEGVTITAQGSGDYNETITINASVADGYEFGGWRVKDKVGDEIAIADRYNTHTTFIMPDSNVTVTAIITKASYTITYKLNGGSVATENPETYDATTENFSLNNPTKNGYTFIGWTGSNGTTPQTNVTIAKGSTGNKEYIANWKANEYAIDYNLNGGESANPTSYTIESNAIELIAPTKAGYTFTGWTGSNGTTPQKSVTIAKGSTGDKEYTANWEIIEYTINYNLNGGAATNPANYTVESNAIELIAPTKDGYTFTGWTGSNGTTPQKSVTIAKGSTGNRSYTANWIANTYTVKFNANNGTGTMEDQVFTYDIAQNLTANSFTRTGYTFASWNTEADGNGTDYANEASVTNLATNGEVTLYAQWTAVTYTIDYNLDDGTVAGTNPTSYTIESEDITLINPTKNGYTFTGWTGSNGTTPQTSVTIAKGSTGNKEYTANWITNTHTASFDGNGGTSGESITRSPGAQLGTLPESTRNGYEFIGWFTGKTDGTQVSETTPMPSNDVTYYAHWNAITYTIDYDLDGGIVTGTNPTSYTIESNAIELIAPTKTGYTFTGWTGSNGTTPQTSVTIVKGSTGNRSYTANWIANTYTVKFNANNGTGTMEDQVFTYDIAQNLTANSFTRTGYTFAGWNTEADGNGTDYANEASVTNLATNGEVTLYAQWTAVTYTIDYNLDNGTVAGTNPTNYTIESEDITLINPTKDGYIFEGWTGSNGTTPQTSVTIAKGSTGDREYTATWTPTGYTILYHLDGGTVTGTNPTSYTIESNAITLINPTKTGYAFAGWTGTELDIATSSVTIAKGSTGNREYTATWTPIEYTIGYVLNDGEVAGNNPTSYTIESNAITLINPTKTGYNFAGWTGIGLSEATTTVTIATGSTGNKLYTATWTPIEYTINYTLNDGVVAGTNPTSYTIESEDITLINPTKTGYTFTGWTGSNGTTPQTSVTIATGSTGNKEYTATWTPTVYTISYDLDGGTGTNPTSYTIESEDITLINPTKDGYIFDGWTGSNGTTPQTTVTIAAGSTGDRNYTANWTEGVAQIVDGTLDGTVYTSIINAINAAPNNVKTKIILLKDTRENFTIDSAKNIVFDFGEYALRADTNSNLMDNNTKTMIRNNGTLEIISGTLEYDNTSEKSNIIANNKGLVISGDAKLISSSDGGVINNNNGATLTMLKGSITNTKLNGGQAIYNNGTLTIGGTAQLTASPLVEKDKLRGCVQVVSGTAKIIGGTIISNKYGLSAKAGTIEIGVKDDYASRTLPVIQGGINGIYSDVNFSFYDGIIKGGTAGIDNEEKVNKKETGYTILHGTETISGTTYETAFLGKQYTITFNAGEGNVSPDAMTVINEDTYAYLPTPTRTAYIFVGWYTEENGGNRINNGDTVNLSADITLYAHWVQNGSLVTYNGTENGGNNPDSNTANVTHGEPIPLNKTASKDGYTFVGWNTDKDATVALESLTMPSDDITLYAIYKKEITVTVNTYGQVTPYTETKTIYNKATNTSFTLPSIASVTVSGTIYTGRGYAEGDVTDGTGTVALASGGNVTLSNNSTYSAMYKATITGTFYYSATAVNTYVKTNGVQASATATAIRYMGYTGTIIENNYVVPVAVTGSAGGAAAKTYKGVAIAVDSAEVVTPTTANTEFYAVYEDDVTYYYYNGTAQTSSTVTRRLLSDGTNYNLSLASAEPVPAAYEGANFYKWSSSQVPFISDVLFDTAVDTSVDELYAVYQKTITVTYNSNGGTETLANSTGTNTYISKKDGTVYINKENITISNDVITKTGSTFEGWNSSDDGTGTDYTSGTAYVFDVDTIIYAKWSANVYSVTLNNQSATFGGTATIYEKYGVGYYIEPEATESDKMTTDANGIIVPTRTGYTFGGYYTESNGNGNQYIDINGKITGNASTTNFAANGVLYAKWTANEYTITLNSQSATTAGTATIYESYGTKFSLTSGGAAMTTSTNGISVPTRTNYAFEGYYTETNGEGTQVIDANGFIVEGISTTLFSADGSIYAKWRDAVNPSLQLAKETYHEGFEDWKLSGGAYIDDSNGALILPDSNSVAKSRYYQAEDAWYVTYDVYTTTVVPGKSKGGSYFKSEYYDSELTKIKNKANQTSNPWYNTALTLNLWTNLDFSNIATNNKLYGDNIEYITLQFEENTSYSKNPERIKNLKVYGQLWAGFYNIKVTASDGESGIKVVKYDSGVQNAEHFVTNGTVVTGNIIRVTENETYTVCVEDKAGNKTLQTIVINKIDKTAPTNTAPTCTKTANSITVTNGQVDNESGLVKVEYAIKEIGGEYGEWQASNEFTGLRSSTTYVIKTRAVNKANLKAESLETTVATDTIEYTITLDNQGATTPGTITIYEKFENNYSLTSGGAAMTPSSNPIELPQKIGYQFNGYYTEQNDNRIQIIDANGYLTSAASNTLFNSNSTIYADWLENMMMVTFDARGGTTSEPTRPVPSDTAIGTLPTAEYLNHIFKGWFTDVSGGTQITDSEIITGNVVYYAQWDDAIAEIDGTYYYTLAAAVASVSTSEETTIRLVKNTSEAITISSGQNIVFDFGTNTLSNNGANIVINNNGTLTFASGTITSNANQIAIKNNSGATLYITGGTIETTGTEQAVYNNGGTVEISGGYISATAKAESSNQRGTVQNQSGTMTITGGTILSPYQLAPVGGHSTGNAVTNKGGTMVIGIKGDGKIDKNSPTISGEQYGINNEVNIKLYDGNIQGKKAALSSDSKIGDTETNYEVKHEKNSSLYDYVYFVAKHKVTFNPNGTNAFIDNNKKTRDVVEREPLGELPVPTRAGYAFQGWFEQKTGGEQVTAETLMGNDDVTYYAHWEESPAAEVAGQQYETINEAIAAANSGAEIKLIADATEYVQIPKNKEVIINMDGHSISNDNTNGIIKNEGTLYISNGRLDSTRADASAIDNIKGTLVIDGLRIVAIGDDKGVKNKQAVYNDGGTCTIKGNTYLESKSSGTYNNVPRSTAHNINGGTMIIESATIVNLLPTAESASNKNAAVSNQAKSTLIIGIKDGSYSGDNPKFIGKKYGVFNAGTLKYYDGRISGIIEAINGTGPSEVEDYYVLDNTTEEIKLEGDEESKTYKKCYLQSPITITPSTLEPTSAPITATITYNSTITSGKKAGFGATLDEAIKNASESTATSVTITGNGYVYVECIDKNGKPHTDDLEITYIE